MRNYLKGAIALAVICFSCFGASAQSLQDTLPHSVTLREAVEYAIKRQPAILQSLADEQITEAGIKSRLADWYPQINFNYNLQHNFVLPTTIVQGNPQRFGVDNTSAVQFALSQVVFNRDALLANRTRNDVRLQSRQMTASSKIETEAAVSKAFYDALASSQQVKVSDENIARIERSLKDAYNQYQAGIADKTDYKRANIALNNARALKKTNEEFLKAKMAYLKSLMGYPGGERLEIAYDSLQMEKEILLDTLQQADYTKRIEFKLLETQQRLLEANLKYMRWGYLPSVSLNGAYNFNYQQNDLSKLYNANYPNSFAAIALSVPLFQGGKRKANIESAQWQLQKNRLDIVGLQNAVSAGYTGALAAYKSELANYESIKENLALAMEVYNIIQLQYKSGVKTYLEVINSETDLRTAQINYYNSLYNLLSSKIDVQKALGQINY
ncbi:MAG: TolC family protein [Chitinophagaceae bacterium]|nr:TolC family protein [Chitinophagaceae bacterium]